MGIRCRAVHSPYRMLSVIDRTVRAPTDTIKLAAAATLVGSLIMERTKSRPSLFSLRQHRAFTWSRAKRRLNRRVTCDPIRKGHPELAMSYEPAQRKLKS